MAIDVPDPTQRHAQIVPQIIVLHLELLRWKKKSCYCWWVAVDETYSVVVVYFV